MSLLFPPIQPEEDMVAEVEDCESTRKKRFAGSLTTWFKQAQSGLAVPGPHSKPATTPMMPSSQAAHLS